MYPGIRTWKLPWLGFSHTGKSDLLASIPSPSKISDEGFCSFGFGKVKNQTQGLMYTRQMVYH
jgi:hypothetical protein